MTLNVEEYHERLYESRNDYVDGAKKDQLEVALNVGGCHERLNEGAIICSKVSKNNNMKVSLNVMKVNP